MSEYQILCILIIIMILERRFRKLKFLQFCIARLLPKKQYLCLLTISVTATYYLSWFIIVTFSSHGIEYLATLAYNHLINIIYIHSQLQPYRTGQLIPIFGTVDFYPRNINSYTFMGYLIKKLDIIHRFHLRTTLFEQVSSKWSGGCKQTLMVTF